MRSKISDPLHKQTNKQTDRQTDRQTDTQKASPGPPNQLSTCTIAECPLARWRRVPRWDDLPAQVVRTALAACADQYALTHHNAMRGQPRQEEGGIIAGAGRDWEQMTTQVKLIALTSGGGFGDTLCPRWGLNTTFGS